MSTEHTSAHYRRKALPLSLVRSVARRQVRLMVERFLEVFPPSPRWKVLDLGVNGSLPEKEAHVFETCWPYPANLTACGLEEPATFQATWPEVRYVRVERGARLPFADHEFDVVYANAVIEHVGNRAAQRAFLEEVLRVGKAAFLTTPNRWYPMELHTALPLLHWLPPELHRPLYRRLGFTFFAREENLNLLDEGALHELVPTGVRFRIEKHHFLGLPSNLMLIVDATSGQ
jgi:SAM-dependent methyltransferase